MNLKILLLPGDGIGAEVTREAVKVLRTGGSQVRPSRCSSAKACWAASRFTRRARRFPQETDDLALEADATLLGAVGLPEFDNSRRRSGRKEDCWASARRWAYTPICVRCAPTRR